MRKFIQSNAQLSWLLIALIATAMTATFVLSASAEDPSTLTIPGKAPEVNGDKAPAEYVSIHVDGGAMRQVLNSFAMQANRNIVLSPEVTNDSVTIHLNNVQWDNALDVILKPYGYGYRQVGDAIVVGELGKLKSLEAVEPLQSRVYQMRYLDASDVKDIIEGQLSARGKISIITSRSQKGWKNLASKTSGSRSGGSLEIRSREEEEQIRSKTIVVSDVPSVLDRVAATLDEIDQMPQQVLVEARFMEVNEDFLRDIGVEMGGSFEIDGNPIGLADQFFSATPNAFKPQSADVTGKRGVLNTLLDTDSGDTDSALTLTPGSLNLSTFGQLSAQGNNWGLLISMLEEDEDTKTLSAPKILTLNNREAAIVVGTLYPIIRTTQSSSAIGEGTRSETLDYYESIGIQLNVVPQICADGYINMVVRPSVTQIINFEGDNNYPIIKTRDTETQILTAGGETIVIGGLLEERETEGVFKVPFLGDIPILGRLFRRDTKDTATIDLLIFLKATIIDEENYDLILEQPDVEEIVMIEMPEEEIIEMEVPAKAEARSVEEIMSELE